MTDGQKTQDAQGTDQGARVDDQGGTEGVGQAQPGSEPQGAETDPETFDRAYVQKLRDEAATHRVAAKRAEDLEEGLRAATIREGAGQVLQDVTDLVWSDEYNDPETGMPSAELVRAAAEELADRKPHLARVRGDIGQGRHSETDEEFSLAGALKQHA